MTTIKNNFSYLEKTAELRWKDGKLIQLLYDKLTGKREWKEIEIYDELRDGGVK